MTTDAFILLGWTPALQREADPLWVEGSVLGRVIRNQSHLYTVSTESAESLCELAGVLKFNAKTASELPVVGDWVWVSQEGRRGTIRVVMPRRTAVTRKVAGETTEAQVLAANVDVVFIVTALDRHFNVARIERFLTLAYESGAQPVVVLNKADKVERPDPYVTETEGAVKGLVVLPISAKYGIGVNALRHYLPMGKTGVVVGSSGVGKSTLINRLLKQSIQKTGEIREADDQGRHTTTHRELFRLPDGGLIIDTPGLREIQLWMDESGLAAHFADITALSARCRFGNCKHANEPGCAVREAVEAGILPRERYMRYCKQRDEIRALTIRKNEKRWREKGKKNRGTLRPC